MKKRLILSIVISFCFVAAIITSYFILKDKKTIKKEKNNFTYLGSYKDELISKENIVFTSYDELKEYFDEENIKNLDFKNRNYVLIPVNHDSCSEVNINPVSSSVNGNKVNVKFEYEARCGVCPQEYSYYLLEVDKTLKEVDLNVKYVAVNDPECDPRVSYKPIIYLYPEEKLDINIKLGYPNLLTTTYPIYNDGWNVLALPDGTLYDNNGRSYYGLYWEGLNYIKGDFKDGFVVKKEDTVKFLEEKLSILGLNEKEANEFIIYWLPELEKSQYNLIRFESLDVINEQMPLEINPKPDVLIRVFMEYSPLEKPININEQKLTSVKRQGYIAVEWGGSKIPF